MTVISSIFYWSTLSTLPHLQCLWSPEYVSILWHSNYYMKVSYGAALQGFYGVIFSMRTRDFMVTFYGGFYRDFLSKSMGRSSMNDEKQGINMGNSTL